MMNEAQKELCASLATQMGWAPRAEVNHQVTWERLRDAGFTAKQATNALPCITLMTPRADAERDAALEKLVHTYFHNNCGENLFNRMTEARAILAANRDPK